MAGINQLISNIDSVNMQDVIENSLIDIAVDLVDAQKDQLKHGKLSTGQKTGTYKNADYAVKKHNLNPLAGYGHKDYKLTGEMWQGVFVDVRATSLVFSSVDPKFTRVLDMNDGDDIMGLSNETISQKIEPKLEQAAVNRIKNQILR